MEDGPGQLEEVGEGVEMRKTRESSIVVAATGLSPAKQAAVLREINRRIVLAAGKISYQ